MKKNALIIPSLCEGGLGWVILPYLTTPQAGVDIRMIIKIPEYEGLKKFFVDKILIICYYKDNIFV